MKKTYIVETYSTEILKGKGTKIYMQMAPFTILKLE